MKVLSDKQARAILKHPFINFTKLAEAYYHADLDGWVSPQSLKKRRPYDALRSVTINRKTPIRPKTLIRLTVVLAPFYDLFSKDKEIFGDETDNLPIVNDSE